MKIREKVQEYKHLGQVVGAHLKNHDRDIQHYIGMASGAVRGKRSQILNSRLPLSWKRMVHNQCAVLVMTCGTLLNTWKENWSHGRKDDGSSA